MSLPTRNGTYVAFNKADYICQSCETFAISIFKGKPRCSKCKRTFTPEEITSFNEDTWKSLNNFKFKGNRYTRTNIPLKPMPKQLKVNGIKPILDAVKKVNTAPRYVPISKRRTLSSIEQETEALRRRLQELQEEKHMIAADSPELFTTRLFRAIQYTAVFFRNHAGSELLKKYKVTPGDLSAMEHIMKMPLPRLEHSTKEKGMPRKEWIKQQLINTKKKHQKLVAMAQFEHINVND
jgi:hypothetical protein